jgi:hypothetical protein
LKVEKFEKKIKIKDIPSGNSILFFGRINSTRGYCIIHGPSRCIPEKEQKYSFPKSADLFSAEVEIGKIGRRMRGYGVLMGSKYPEGGGFVETKKDLIWFFPKNSDKKPTINKKFFAKVLITS